jgi:hypothetical protein
VDFEFSERKKRGLPETTQGVILQHLRDGVVSRVVCSSLAFGHCLGQRWLPTPPSNASTPARGKDRVMRARAYPAGKCVGESPVPKIKILA